MGKENLHLSTDFSELWLYFKSGIKMSLRREKVALSISRTKEPHPQRTAVGTSPQEQRAAGKITCGLKQEFGVVCESVRTPGQMLL